MRNILVAVDGSVHAEAAVRFVLGFVREHGDVGVHLVNVEPQPVAWQTHGMEQAAIEAHLAAVSQRAIEPARTALAAAGVRSHAHARVGDVAATIVETAEKLGCDAIVIGTRGLGAMAGLAMGSVARKVLHLSKLPVICVK